MNKAVIAFPLIIISLLAAVWGGWIRIGWTLPVSQVSGQHGGLMVNSFLASLIFLERAVTFKNRWMLLLPIVNAISIIPFLLRWQDMAHLFFVFGAAGFLILCIYFVFVYKEIYYYVFVAAAFCLLAGNVVLYKTNFYPHSITWWTGFLLFTIVAERLELSRYLAVSNTKKYFLLAFLAITFIALILPFHIYGNALLSLGIILTAAWLLKYDMARYSIRAKGQHRYSGLLLITGYFWLIVMSVLLLFQHKIPFGYDAVLHSFFIGFVFSMIFSHAPIILPAVSKLPVKIYRPVLYVWFVLMQLSLTVRIIADVVPDVFWRKWSGMVNGISILLFFVSIAVITVKEARQLRVPFKKINTAL